MAYAESTSVPIERTRAQIEKELRKYGADQFISGWDHNRAFISFRAMRRLVRFVLPLPKRDDKKYSMKPPTRSWFKPTPRSEAETTLLWEQACRARWRALLLTVKAKLESIQTGIESFEQAFLAHIVLPDDTLVGDRIISAVADAYATGKMPQLPAPRSVDVEDTE